VGLPPPLALSSVRVIPVIQYPHRQQWIYDLGAYRRPG
jgi:hypothetical protein